MLSNTPEPPYYAVIFSNVLDTANIPAYEEMAERMLQLAADQPGYLGVEFARKEIGITISYWRDLASIQKWRNHPEHIAAQVKGKEEWYSAYKVRIVKIERAYSFERNDIN